MEQKDIVWKDVIAGEQFYQVSNTGLVKRKAFTRRYGDNAHSKYKEMILKPYTCSLGYKNVALYMPIENGLRKKRAYGVHQLVAKAFINNPDNKPHVNHKNGNSSDNLVGNLEWCTPKENVHHAIITGLTNKPAWGEKHSCSKLTNQQVKDIRAHRGNMTHEAISRIYGVSRTTITNILNNKSYMPVREFAQLSAKPHETDSEVIARWEAKRKSAA